MSPRGRRPHKIDAGTPPRFIPLWWREMLKEWLGQHGKSHAWLAERAGCNRSQISLMLSGKVQMSTVVEPICNVTGLSPPGQRGDVADPKMAKVVAAIMVAEQSNPGAVDEVIGFARQLARPLRLK